MSPAGGPSIVTGSAGVLMILAMVPGASWLGLALAAITAATVVGAHWFPRGAPLAVQTCALELALEGTSVVPAVVAGVAATALVLGTYLGATPVLLLPAARMMLPVLAATTLVAIGAAALPGGPGWLALLAPLLVVVLYAGAVLPYSHSSRL